MGVGDTPARRVEPTPEVFGLSRKVDYAVVALARLVLLEAGPAAEADSVSARELAEADDLPAALLSSLLKRLQRAGIVRSQRGAHGGYVLAHQPEQIRLGDVIRAVDDLQPVRLTMCCGGGSGESAEQCQIMARCPITRPMQRLNGRMSAFLDEMTLADLLPGKQPQTTAASGRMTQ